MARNVDEALAQRLGLREARGAFIVAVLPCSPASQAGLKRGDVIRQIGGAEVASARDLATQVQQSAPGDELVITILRDGNEQTMTVVLGERPRHPLLEAKKPTPFLSWLKGLKPAEVFEHFLGGELRFKDLEGQPQTLRIVAGVVEGVGEESLRLIPNGETEATSFTVSVETLILRLGEAIPLSEVQSGDKALVVTLGQPDDAKLVVLIPQQLGQLRRHHPSGLWSCHRLRRPKG